MLKTTRNKTLLATSIALTLGVSNVEAALVTGLFGNDYWWSTPTDGTPPPANYTGNLTVLAANGGVAAGSNTIGMEWDGNAYDASTDYVGPGGATNASIMACCTSGGTVAFGYTWTAHDIQIFVPGNYSFDTALGGGNPESDLLNLTVPTGHLGMHMLWDWNGNQNIDVVAVFAVSSVFGSGILASTDPKCLSSYTGTITGNCLYDLPTYGVATTPVKDQIWMLASVDGDGDGVMGVPMAAGPVGYSLNFNFNLTGTYVDPGNPPPPIPIPAAAWLLGSGLLGLVGTARRRKSIQE